MREIVNELVSIIERGLPCVVCTVAATRGSTPQKAGAMMLVFADGRQSGTLGGGCVEAEVRQRALAALTNAQSEPQVHTFNLDDDYGWDDGLICGGRMTIVAEPLSKQHAPYYSTLKKLLNEGQACLELIALSDNPVNAQPGTRMLFDGKVVPLFANEAVTTFARKLPANLLRPVVIEGFAALPTRARIRLLIVGGGHVGQAVARLAHDLDFDVWVIDDREKFANADRFPNAHRIVGDIGGVLSLMKQDIGSSTYCLIVTRGHSHDEEALYHLATTDAGYVGMIGSKRKVKLIFDDLRQRDIPEAALAKVRAPIGLNIGSQTVPEIAVSILAELIAVRNLGQSPPIAMGGLSKE